MNLFLSILYSKFLIECQYITDHSHSANLEQADVVGSHQRLLIDISEWVILKVQKIRIEDFDEISLVHIHLK
jgi:hypothetical protein